MSPSDHNPSPTPPDSRLTGPVFSMPRRSWKYLTVLGLIFFAGLTGEPAFADGSRSPIEAPWGNEPPVGLPFTVRGVDNVPDLHGDPVKAQLVLFVAGNQFMVLPSLVKAFKKLHPDIRHLFYETLPPGILAKQIEKGGLTIGNLHLTVKPDIYESGAKRMASEKRKGEMVGPVVPFARNNLAIMVARDNPRHIRSLGDLAHPKIRLSLPNPKWEGIGNQIRSSFKKAGGEKLVHTIFVEKRKNGTTFLTHIHHRQTAYRILRHQSDAGITWISEVLFQQRIGHPIGLVRIPDAWNTEATYVAAQVKGAPHPDQAKRWLAFLKSPQAQSIYRQYGFQPPQ
ncbi:MAG: molybdate ABC transporter substrate-binding protein [Leptospirales bacterium]